MKRQVADRYMLVLMIVSDLERRDMRVKFYRRISLLTLVPVDRERPNLTG